MNEKDFNKRIEKLFAEKRQELLEKLKRLDLRKKEGWGYRRRLREGYKVETYRVPPHHIWVPVKRR